VHLFNGSIAGNPSEPLLLEAVTLHRLRDSEQARCDEELATKHYLKNAGAVGRVPRYVAEYQDQWVGSRENAIQSLITKYLRFSCLVKNEVHEDFCDQAGC
jgi:hypothetical protein